MDGDWVFSATTTCAILPEPNLDTVGNVVLRNRSAVRVSGPLIDEFRGISALVPKNVMDGDWVFSATTTCASLPEPNLDTVGNVVLRNRSAVRVSGPLIAEFRGISALVPKNVMDGDWVSGNHDLRYSSRTKFRYSGKCGSKKPVRCSRLRSFNRRIPRNKRPVPKNVMDGDWVFSATTTCAILPEPNLDTWEMWF